jgi:glucan phosphoethanolaminetransferase (alkaline phosphatase superfamily)
MRLRAFFRDEATRLAIYFVLLLEVWETVFFGTNLGHYIQFYHQSKLMFIGLLALVALGTGLAFLYVRLSLALKLPLRLLALVLFAVGIVVEYGYAATLGRFSTAEDIGQALTFVDATAFLEYGWLYAPWACLVPVAAYGFLLLRFASVKERSGMAFGAGLALIVVFYSVAFPFSHGTFPTLSFSAFSRSVVFATWEHLLGYNVTRAQHSFSSKQTPANNVVFIVDESVRPDHLGVNQYRRPTTPFLRRLRDEGRLTNWGTAVSGATSSVASNALLLTGVQRVPDTFAYTKRWPTIFQYAKTMGYKTYYFDASSSNFWLGSKSDLDSIDEWRNQEVLGPSTIDADFAVAREVRRIISNSTGNFIWVNKRGSHFPYHDNFPTGAMIWGPVMDSNTTKFSDAIKSRNRRRLVNSYDNSIRYNVDGFFQNPFRR